MNKKLILSVLSVITFQLVSVFTVYAQPLPIWSSKYSQGSQDSASAITLNSLGNGGDYSFTVQTDAGGNVYMAGRSDIGGNQRYTILKYNAAGTLAAGFPYIYNGTLATTFDEAHSLKVDAAGNIYVTGKSGVAGLEDYLTIAVSSAGTLMWAKKYNGNANSTD